MTEEFSVGKKVKELRLQNNMSAKDLAQKAEISVGMLSQLEKGSTQGSVETLRKIAKVLNTTLAHIFTNEEEQIKKPVSDEASYIVRKEKIKEKKSLFPILYTTVNY